MIANRLLTQITALPDYHSRGYGEWLTLTGVGSPDRETRSMRFTVRCVRGKHSIDVYGRQLVEWLKLFDSGSLKISFIQKDTILKIQCDRFTARFKRVVATSLFRVEV